MNELTIKDNSLTIANENDYNEIIKKVLDSKNYSKKTSSNYRWLKGFDVLCVNKGKKLILPLNKSESDNIKYYVLNNEIFDLLKAAHVSTGHGGLYKMYNNLKDKYSNITGQSI